MENDSRASQSKKRNRVLLSCVECHRRKQKCDRATPCSDCAARGLPHRCKYMAPPKQPRTARLRRVVSGNEVTLTPESIDALAADTQEASPLPNADMDLQLFSTPEADVTVYGITEQFLPNLEFCTTAMNQSSLPLRPTSPNVASGLGSHLDLTFLGGMDPFSSLPTDATAGEPVLTEVLVHYFAMVLAPWLSYLDDTLTETSPRISWLPYAVNHTPLFYATLLTAAVHLDRRQPLKDPSVLLRLKVQTITFANKNMNNPSEAVSDQMMMVAMVLLYFNVGGDNCEEFEIHLKGIHQMLLLRGGKENLGMNGMVKNWLGVCYGPWQDDWVDGAFQICKA